MVGVVVEVGVVVGVDMKIEMIKEAGGIFRPVTDIEQDKTIRFKTGELYTVEIKHTRNYQFHKKVFAFLNFCFDHWAGDQDLRNLDIHAQFNRFRNQLTVLAGYYTELYNINGEVRVEARSISYSGMEQEDFESFYNALINAAMKHIFRTTDENTYNQLVSFF